MDAIGEEQLSWRLLVMGREEEEMGRARSNRGQEHLKRDQERYEANQPKTMFICLFTIFIIRGKGKSAKNNTQGVLFGLFDKNWIVVQEYYILRFGLRLGYFGQSPELFKSIFKLFNGFLDQVLNSH